MIMQVMAQSFCQLTAGSLLKTTMAASGLRFWRTTCSRYVGQLGTVNPPPSLTTALTLSMEHEEPCTNAKAKLGAYNRVWLLSSASGAGLPTHFTNAHRLCGFFLVVISTLFAFRSSRRRMCSLQSSSCHSLSMSMQKSLLLRCRLSTCSLATAQGNLH